jgi:hypothetical protein
MVKITIIPGTTTRIPNERIYVILPTTQKCTSHLQGNEEWKTERPVKHVFLLSLGLKIFPKSNILKEHSRDHTYKSLSTVLLLLFCAVWNIPP